MKKIKLLFLITLIITLCTGCSIEYNINITKDNIEETINVTDKITENRTQRDILNHYNMRYPTFVNFINEGESIEIEDFSQKYNGIEYNTKTIKEITEGYNYTYKYTYDIDKYYDAYSLANVYIETTALNEDNALVLRTEKENLLCQYDYFDSLKVNITIDPKIYELNYTNTSNINNNTYTWYLDKNNCNNSEIILTLNKIEESGEEIVNPNDKLDKDNDKDSNKKDYTMYIFYGILLLIILLGYLIFKKIKKNSEKFDIDD